MARRKPTPPVQLGDGIFVLKDANVLIQLDPTGMGYTSTEYGRNCELGEVKAIKLADGKSKNIRYWGANNNLPAEREALIMNNNIVGALIQTKRDITIGSGLMAYKEIKDGKKTIKEPLDFPDQISDWLDATDIDDYLMTAAKEFYIHVNVFNEFISKKDGSRGIARLSVKESKHTRVVKRDQYGKINSFIWCGNWKGHNSGKKNKCTAIPAYDGSKKQGKFMIRTGDNLFSDGSYFIPAYWGGKTWISLSNCIPEFHLANLCHGYTIRFHVKVPKDYFYDFSSVGQNPSAKELTELHSKASAAEQAFITELNKFFAGHQNAGRALVTKYEIDKAFGKDYPGIIVEAINVDLKDNALLELFAKSNEANMSAQGVHPVLANIQTQGKLSSGSEMRNAYNMFLSIKTPMPRKILLKPIELVRKLNKWNDIEGFGSDVKIGFKDTEITNLDENPAGTQPAITA